MTRPLLAVAAFLALGAWLGSEHSRGLAIVLLVLAALLLVLALLARAGPWSALALGGAALALGAGAAAVEGLEYRGASLTAWVAGHDADEPACLEGRLLRDPWVAGDRQVLVVEASRLEQHGALSLVTGRARVTVGGATALSPLSAGDRVRVWTTLRPPRNFANPGSPDAMERARREGVHALGYCKSAMLAHRVAPGQGTMVAMASRFRAWSRARISAALPPGPEEALVRAMVLGDRSGLDPEIEESFRIAGTYHVLALSGAQVALVAGVLLFGLGRLEAPPACSAVLVSAILGFYAVLVGGDVPILRAVVLAVALLAGRGLDLDADLPNLLGLSALVLLVDRPSCVGDVSFQLSFGATLAILLFVPSLVRALPALPLRAELALAGSIAAQVALAPLLAAHFHRIAPAALLLNLVAVPLSGAVLLSGALAVALSPISTLLACGAADAAWIFAHALLRSADVVRIAPWVDLRVPGPTLLAATVHGAGLLLATRPAWSRLGWCLVLAGLALILFPRSPEADGRLHVTALDVGQGDALVIRTPAGHIWLVDAGGGGAGQLDLGEAVVAPYLWSLPTTRVEGLVVTHAHPDHVGGAEVLLRSFAVGAVLEGIAPSHDAVYSRLDHTLHETASHRLSVSRGFRAEWDGVRVEVLAPQPPARTPWRVRNDDSVVLALRYGEVTILLTGDIEGASETGLPVTRADVLKVPHHGSRTSSGAPFLAATEPRVAIVSAGFRNRFGHPHAEVLERYRRLGCRVLRTDRDGAITVSTDGRDLRFTTFNGSAGSPRLRGSGSPRGL
jgi:competence protein ComEC